jgi:peptidoglycan/LPS O-acetylase OafA/YrhL
MQTLDGRERRVVEATGEVQPLLPASWAWFAGVVGPMVAAFCIAIEPSPADPNASEPLIATALGTAFFVAMVGAGVQAGRRRVSALTWACAVGVLAVVMTISCPLSGHHENIGMWWAAQFIVSAAALAVTAGGRYEATLRQ